MRRIRLLSRLLPYLLIILVSIRYQDYLIHQIIFISQPSSQRTTTTSSSNHLIVTTDSKYWTSNRSPELPNGIRIAIRLSDNGEFGIRTDDPCYKLPHDVKKGHSRMNQLPPTLTDVKSAWQFERGRDTSIKEDVHDRIYYPQQQSAAGSSRGGRYLDFQTDVSTDLRILFLGDSVADQIGRAFDNAASGYPGDVALKYAKEVLHPNETTSSLFDRLPTNPRISLENFRVYGETRSCLFASGTIRGGGYIGMWRVVKLLSTGRKDGPTCNSHGGGWNDKQYKQMVEQEFRPSPNSMTNETITIGKYDAVILRIQLGWMAPSAITREGLEETITLCRDYLSVETVVVMTINFTNDVHNPGEWAWASNMNSIIRELAQVFNKNATAHGSNFHIQIMEFGNFTTQVHFANARTILSSTELSYEYPNLNVPNVSIQDYDQTEEAQFLFDRFKPWHVQDNHPQSIPTVCGKMCDEYIDTARGDIRRNCIRNAIMDDGLHWCMSSVGPRYHAGLSCLLGCVYNRRKKDNTMANGTVIDRQAGLEQCERNCNEQFMSLLPIDETWLGVNTTVYSTG